MTPQLCDIRCEGYIYSDSRRQSPIFVNQPTESYPDYLAVVDRFEEDKAVLLVGDNGQQLVVDRALLPPATQEGHWLQVEIRDGELIRAEIDEGETERARTRIASKLDELRREDYLKEQ